MSNQSPFQSFSFTANDDVFVQPVGNSDYLPCGLHEVRIESVEFDNSQYGPQLKLSFIDDKGAKANDYVSLIAKNKEGETGVKPGYKYLMLGQALVADPLARVAFLNKMVPTNPHLADCIKNTRVIIEIVEPTKGHTIRDVSGQKTILDLETNTYITETIEEEVEYVNAKGEKATRVEVSTYDKVFASFDEAKAFMDAAGLKRAYNKIAKYKAVSAEQQAANQAIMQPALDPFMGKPKAAGSSLPQRKAAPARPTV